MCGGGSGGHSFREECSLLNWTEFFRKVRQYWCLCKKHVIWLSLCTWVHGCVRQTVWRKRVWLYRQPFAMHVNVSHDAPPPMLPSQAPQYSYRIISHSGFLLLSTPPSLLLFLPFCFFFLYKKQLIKSPFKLFFFSFFCCCLNHHVIDIKRYI